MRAYCALVCPGLAQDATAGAPDIAAERYVIHYLTPPTLDRIIEALDRDTRFIDLKPSEQKDKVARLRFDANTRRDLDVAAALTLMAVYGTWSGRDEHGDLVRAPLGWQLASYSGPTPLRFASQES
jgi:hypothetical protein